LTLSAIAPTSAKLLLPERFLTLTRSNNTLTVGRASKVSTKGFIAALDNAWFDSPVMSRQHAQFVADMGSKKIKVSDLGSLHGTFLNGEERIPKNESREVRHGDTLRFGGPIWRGTEKFVPATVRVGVEFVNGALASSAGSTTFQVPEGSDDDASEGSQYDGVDDTIEESDMRRPWASNPGPNTPVVDLTGPRHSGHQICEVIDLSSPCPSPIHIIGDDEEEELANIMAADEPDDVDVGTSTVGHTTHTEIADSIVAHPVSGAAHHIYDPRIGDYADDMDDMDGRDVDPDDLNEEEDDDSDADPDRYGSHVGYDFYLDDESQLDSSDEHPDNYDDFGSDADMGGAEDMEESEAGYMAEADILGIEAGDEDSPGPWDNLLPSAQEFEYPEVEPLIASLAAPAATSQSANPKEAIPRVAPSCSIEQLLNREKPQPPAPAAVQEPLHVIPQSSSTAFGASMPNLPGGGSLVTPQPSAPTPTTAAAAAQILGAKTGKTDFFLARQQNKMALNAQKMGNHWPTVSVHSLCNDDEAADEPGNYNFSPAAVAKPVSPAASLPRLYHPDRTSIVFPRREAAAAEGSAPPAAVSPAHANVDACARRTHVGISDIVDSCVEEKGEKQSKRKAENISTSTEEQEAWIAKAPSPAPLEEPPVAAANPAAEAPVVVPWDHERPRKKPRMLRVAERLGYAALGGVTAGAMIMGTLIYTAPTFS
ncbi:hypothetical protein C8A05DRAFT_17777, partial [Staphylotrichum tortipilum]